MEIAICFYTLETWKELKKVAADKKKLDDSYEDWLIGFNNAITTFKGQGFKLVVIKVDIKDLQLWCSEHNFKNDGGNRAKYASEMAMKLQG